MSDAGKNIASTTSSDDGAPKFRHRRIQYAEDPTGSGFYWKDSEQKRREVMAVKRGDNAAFESTYQGRPGAREGTIFLSSDLDAFYIAPRSLTAALISPEVAAFTRRGHCVIQAWDTAFSTSSQSAHSVCVTALLLPCSSYHRNEDPATLGPCDFHFDVLLLNVLRKKLDWGGLTNALKEQFHAWRPEEIVIEKKASGISLIQSMESAGFPIIPARASESKGARAVNSVSLKTAGSVQGWFRQHRVLCPNDATIAPWLSAWRAEMKDFSGNDDASSDQVDATVHLVTRAIQLGSSAAVLPSDWSPERSELASGIIDPFASPNAPPDQRLEFFQMLGEVEGLSENPFSGMCATCAHNTRRVEGSDMAGNAFCDIHKRTMLTLDSCQQFENGIATDAQHARDMEGLSIGRL